MTQLFYSILFLSVVTIFSISTLYISTTLEHIYDIVIIGAGPSGIAATSKLLKSNKNNILVLEAGDRIGGRINSVKFGKFYVEMGAQWVFEQPDNAVYNLAKPHGVLEYKNYSNWKFFYSNRQELPEALLNEVNKIIADINICEIDEEGISIGDYCMREFSKRTARLTIPNDFPHLLDDLNEYLKHEVISAKGVMDWHELAARSDNKDCYVSYVWKENGYKTILDILLQKFPYSNKPLKTDDKILLNKEVSKIQWDNNDDTIKIRCSDGTEFMTKSVIFTPSLGVLKAEMNNMFEPSLPDNKKRAIKTLGIGAIAKVTVEFSNDWWNKYENIDFLYTIWEKNMRESQSNFSIDGYNWINNLSAIIPEKCPNVLSLWFDGTSIPIIETMEEQKLIDGIEYTLRQFFGHKFDVTSPIKLVRSRWYTHPHFRGVISYQTLESRKKPSNIDLSEPVKNRNGKEVLFFAGEATSPLHYGTVHGAIETGLREASRFIQ